MAKIYPLATGSAGWRRSSPVAPRYLTGRFASPSVEAMPLHECELLANGRWNLIGIDLRGNSLSQAMPQLPLLAAPQTRLRRRAA